MEYYLNGKQISKEVLDKELESYNKFYYSIYNHLKIRSRICLGLSCINIFNTKYIRGIKLFIN